MKKLQEYQKEFDQALGFDFPAVDDLTAQQQPLPGTGAIHPEADAKQRRVEYCVLALSGEVGEMANLVKKARRSILMQRGSAERSYLKMQDEAADVLAYLLKLSNVMGWNLEEAYLSKMERNAARFNT